MIKHFYLYFLIPFFLCSSAFAQSGIKGRISDGVTKETLLGVNVVVSDSMGTVTDLNGNYSLELKPGTYEVTYRYIGYETQILKTEIVDGTFKTQDMILKESSRQLDEVVVTAGKFEQKVGELTVSMEVIKPSLVQNKNTTDMDQIIDQTPGVAVVDGQANIRGGAGYSYGAGSRVLLMVDDMPMLSADAGDVKWDYLPIENLEQIEIIKGASSALFGSSALNGVINIRTAYAKDKPETKIITFAGMYNRFERDSVNWWNEANPIQSGTSFYHARKMGSSDLVLGGFYLGDQGYRQLETEQRGRFNANYRYRFKKIDGLAAGVNVNSMYKRFGLFLIWQNADSGALKPSGGSVSSNINYKYNIDPYVTYYGKNGDRIYFKSRYYYVNNINNTNQGSVSDLIYTDLQYQKRFKRDMTMTGGFVTTFSRVRSQLYKNHDGVNYAGYYQLDKKFFQKLNLSFGVRGEYFRINDFETETDVALWKGLKFSSIDQVVIEDTVAKSKYVFKDVKRSDIDSVTLIKGSKIKPVFRLGLSYELTKATFLRASFGQGYRFPSVAERYVQTSASGLTIYPNDSLQPETGWSAEFGIKQGFKISDWYGYVDLAGFWTEYYNMMQFTSSIWGKPTDPLGGFGFKSINVGQARISGYDGSIVGKGKIYNVGTTILAGYTYINPINLSFADTSQYSKPQLYGQKMYEDTSLKNDFLKYRFKHMIKADVQLDYWKLSYGISYRYTSNMPNIDPIFESLIVPGLKRYRQVNNKGYHVFDMRFSYQMTEQSKVAMIVNNVFNVEYMTRPAYIMPPRTFLLQYTLSF